MGLSDSVSCKQIGSLKTECGCSLERIDGQIAGETATPEECRRSHRGEHMPSKKAYEKLSDLENLQKQWRKLSGLHKRGESSGAIVRAATAAEIAANYAIRQELITKRKLESEFVDNLLRWANGLSGKLERLLIPLTSKDADKAAKMRELKGLANDINTQRNSIVHQGEFCNEDEAKRAIEKTQKFIVDLIRLYEPEFKLDIKK
jgi:hypothetical protein